MAEQENRVSIRFTNALFIEIFGRYASNSEMAEFIAPDGSVELDCLMVNGVIDPPKSCEQMLSLMYALFETNPKSAIGRIFMANQLNILRETVYRLPAVLDGFSEVKMSIDVFTPSKGDPEKKVKTHTEFTMTKTKTTHTDRD